MEVRKYYTLIRKRFTIGPRELQTSVVCKLMESVIRDSVTTRFKLNHLFSNKQFGFIKGRSTSLQLSKILDKWTELLENGGQIYVIYTDFEKAFDKIPHKRLISKLFSYGLNKDIIIVGLGSRLFK